jgi:phenylpropionate dioxygenase-like ring-hydroxylating dioxygenase large terminal subunit
LTEATTNGQRNGNGAAAPRSGTTKGPRYEAAVLGFRHYWYPGVLSRHLGNKPVAIKLLGEDLVFFRANGRAYALRDMCAHRGVPLRFGTCLSEGTVTCGYHGWTYDVATGKCVAALTDGPDSPVAGRYSVKSYPVEERGGIVFVYMGDDNPPPLEEDVPEEVIAPGWTQQAVVSVWEGNWRAAVENGYDAGHAPYVHRNSLRWRTAGSLQPAWSTFAGTEMVGPYLRQKRGKPGGPEADYPVVGHWPRYSWLRRYLAKIGKKGGRERPYPNEFRLPCMIHNKYFYYTHVRWAVPVDEHNTRNFQVYAGQFEGTRSLAFKLHYWLWHRWVFHMQFNGQDEWIVGALDYDAPERLYRPDASLTELRRYVETNARASDPVPGGSQVEAGSSEASATATKGQETPARS